MTGFGRSEDVGDGMRLTCEMRSVNHRFLAFKWRLPPSLGRYEPWIETRVRRFLSRGSVEVFLQLRAEQGAGVAQLDPRAADHYLKSLGEYARRRGLAGTLSPDSLFQLPGVLVAPDPATQAASVKPLLERVVDAALEASVKMRAREGARLAKALLREVAALERCVKVLVRRAPRLVKEYRARLEQRIAALLQGTQVTLDPPTLSREVALFAERTDVTEELDRLRSHLSEFRAILGREGPIGRSLDFLTQELGREVQTLGAKTQDLASTNDVLEAKASVERLREQVQNLE